MCYFVFNILILDLIRKKNTYSIQHLCLKHSKILSHIIIYKIIFTDKMT